MQCLRGAPRPAAFVGSVTRSSQEGTSGHDERGLVEYLVIYGRARISKGSAPTLLQRLAHTYLGPEVEFPPPEVARPGDITHIIVDRIAGVGP
jgi:hypothetical protein